MDKNNIMPASDEQDSSSSPPSSSTDEYDASYNDNVPSLMTNSYGDISGDESGMFDRLLSDNDQSICDEEMDENLVPVQSRSSRMSDMVKKSASNLTEELDHLVRQAYMETSVVHELADEATEDEFEGASNATGQQSSSLNLSELRGLVTRDGDLVSFVADDLNEKIRLSSPSSRKSETPGSRSSTPSLNKQALNLQIPLIDPNVINELEHNAHRVASAVDNMLENLTGTLHSMSSLTVDCMDVYKTSVCKTCDVVDANIKLMYQLMAKCEELNKSMSPIYLLAHQTKEIKRVLELFENLVDSSR